MDSVKQFLTTHNKRFWVIVLWVSVLSFVVYKSFHFLDTDIYNVIPTGRYILENGFPKENPFTFNPGLSVVIYNWLYSVVLALFYNKLYTFGLWILHFCTLILFFTCVFRFFKFRESKNKILIAFFTIVLLVMFGYVNLRAELLTFILLVVEIDAIERFRDTGKTRYLWLLPLTVLLEINSHASYWVVHYVVLLPYLVTLPHVLGLKDVHISGRYFIKMLPYLLFSILMLFINPYGVGNVLYVFYALTSGILGFSNILEQNPFSISSPFSIGFIVFLIFFLVMLYKKKLLSTEFYMYIGFSFLFFFAAKWLPFYTISLMFLFRCLYRQTIGKEYLRIEEFKFPNFISVLIAIANIFLIGLAIYVKQIDIVNVFNTTSDFYMDTYGNDNTHTFYALDSLADYLDDNDPDATVYAYFHRANYFEFRGYKIFTDSRPELYVKEICGTDDYSILDYKVAYGCDIVSLHRDNSKNKMNHVLTYDMNKVDYVLSYAEYGRAVDSVNADYYVVDVTSNPALYHYLEDNTDKYECVATSGEYLMFKRL